MKKLNLDKGAESDERLKKAEEDVCLQQMETLQDSMEASTRQIQKHQITLYKPQGKCVKWYVSAPETLNPWNPKP